MKIMTILLITSVTIVCIIWVWLGGMPQKDRPVILGQFRTDRGKYARMKIGIKLGYKWVEAVPSDIDEGGARVIIGHTVARGRDQSENETLGQPKHDE